MLIGVGLVLSLGCGSGSETPPPPTINSDQATGPVAGKADGPVSDSCQPTVRFGAFTYGGVWQGMEPVERLETTLGTRLEVVQWFTNFSHDWPAAHIDLVAEGGRAPLITWQPTGRPLAAIAAGEHDEYIRSWAQGAAELGTPVYLRPFPEMNGEWVSWWEDDPAALVAAWQHVVDVFREEGAGEVRWVWSPNVTDVPRTERNQMENYYPGDEYVDVLAVDGYNWGNQPWVSFDDKFRDAYDRITTLGPQPFWVTEVGSTEVGGDKARWVREMLTTTAFPRLEMVVWFDEDKEWDWRTTSSEATCMAFCECLSDRGELDCLVGDGQNGCAFLED